MYGTLVIQVREVAGPVCLAQQLRIGRTVGRLDWTYSGAFGFSSSSSSSNHIQVADIADDSSCSGCLALTSVWGNPIYQFRIEVNIGSGYAFYDGTQAPSLPSNFYDLRSIMRHELGHAQGLCHSSNSSYLMYRAFGTGQIKLVDTDAINGRFGNPIPHGQRLFR